MADIRINELPLEPSPNPSEFVAIDGVFTKKTSLQSAVNSAAPVATESQAQIGSDNNTRMTPLTTKQSISFEVGLTLASKIQGDKADSAVQSVNGKTGNSVTLVKGDVGLGNVDNTSDANKPISTATQTALDSKANSSVTISAGTGLTGGGSLAANRTIALNSTSIASLSKADSSVQTVNGVAPTSGNVNVAATETRLQDTVATAAAASYATNILFVETSGYSSPGDGGGALYRKVSSEPSHPGKFQSSDGKWWELSSEVVNVKSLGAGGVGGNDQAAIQNAILVAESRAISSYWSKYYPAVYLPKGTYGISGLTISYPIKFYGDSNQSVSLGLISGSNKDMIIVKAVPNDFPSADSYRASADIRDISLTGNSANQTVGSGIVAEDSPRPLSTQYDGSINLTNVIVRDCKQNNYYMGRNRNHGSLINCKGLYASGSNIQILGYDWRISDCDFGHATLNNITFSEGGAHSVEGTYCYISDGDAIRISYAVNASCMIMGGYIEGSKQNGVYVDGPSSNSIKHVIIGNSFRDNSQTNNGIYSHIHLKGQRGTVVRDNTFIQLSDPTVNGRPQYLITLEDSLGIQWSGSYSTAAGNDRPYTASNFCNVTNELIYCGDNLLSLRRWGNSTMRLQGASPKFNFWDETQGTDGKNWQWSCGSGLLQLNVNTDANGLLLSLMQFARSGAIQIHIPDLAGRRQIETGAANSGGTGYRMLRVKETP